MDYRTMVNPTFLTARSTLLMLAAAGNEDAGKISAVLGTRDDLINNGRAKNRGKGLLPEAEFKAVMAGVTVSVEARYEAVSHFLRKGGFSNLLDIACGYTPRALFCQREGIDYVGFDVPVVAEELQQLAEKTGIIKDHPVYVGGDATNAASLTAAADLLEGAVLISSEGLMGYLSENEMIQFIGGIREVLRRHGGVWITSDLGVDYEAFATVNIDSPDSARLYREAKKRSMDSSNIYNEGIARWEQDRVKDFFASNGLCVEIVPFYSEDEDLRMLHALPEAWAAGLKGLLTSSTLWKMTLDPAYEEKPVIEGAKEVENLEINYSRKDGTLFCDVSGRIDTISAPALLEVFENNYEGISKVQVDAERLEYISSAGLRVLMMAVKKLGQGSVILVNTSQPVKDIFETTGFDRVINI